jgi:hypothetical protein
MDIDIGLHVAIGGQGRAQDWTRKMSVTLPIDLGVFLVTYEEVLSPLALVKLSNLHAPSVDILLRYLKVICKIF